MKRWKSIFEEYNYELHYKPGKMNVVADAISRITPQEPPMHTLSIATNSDESSSRGLIHSVETPLMHLKTNYSSAQVQLPNTCLK